MVTTNVWTTQSAKYPKKAAKWAQSPTVVSPDTRKTSPHMAVDPRNAYHTSAVLGAAVDVATSPLRFSPTGLDVWASGSGGDGGGSGGGVPMAGGGGAFGGGGRAPLPGPFKVY